MQLYTPEQAGALIQGRVCRHSRLIAVVGVVVMFLFFAVMPAFLIWHLRPSLWISGPALFFAAMFLKWLAGIAIKACRSTNWLMRIGPDGLWINLRSYLNRDFAPAATVLFVSYREIASVRSYTVRRSERTSKGVTAWTDRYLEIQLENEAPPEVLAEISDERRRKKSREYFGGFITSRSRNGHVPVSMPTNSTLRLAWLTRYDFIVPRLKRVLRELSSKCLVLDGTVKDVSDARSLTREDVDRLVLECVETGDTLGAVKLLRDERGMSLADSKRFIDELAVQL